MLKFPQISAMAALSAGMALLALNGCDDSPDPAVANPQATAASFIEALRSGDEEAAEETVLDEEDLAKSVAASTRARLELDKAYSEKFGGNLIDDPNLTLLRLARQPALVKEGDLDLQGDVALLDVGEGKQLRFKLEDDEWKLDLAASLGLDGDEAVEQATAANRANAQKWAGVAQKIRDGEYEDKDQVVSALMDTAAGNTIGNPSAAD